MADINNNNIPKDPVRIFNDEHDKVRNAKRVISLDGFSLAPYDYIEATYPTTSSEVYTYKTGGGSGTVVGTITVNYTDDTKSILSSVVKT